MNTLTPKKKLIIFFANLQSQKKITKEEYTILINSIINKNPIILNIIRFIEERENFDENLITKIIFEQILKISNTMEFEEIENNMEIGNNNKSTSTWDNNFSVNDSKSSRESSPIGDFLLKKKLENHYTKENSKSLKSFKFKINEIK